MATAHKNTVEGKLDLLIKKEEERNRYLKALCKLKQTEISANLMKEGGILDYQSRNTISSLMAQILNEAFSEMNSQKNFIP